MRILHVGKFFPPFAGGIEHFLADLLSAQLAMGIKVAALVHHEDPGWRSQFPPPGEAQPLVWRAPCWGRLLYAPLSPSFPWWLDRAIRAFAPDLLHLHLPNTSAFSALLIPRARRLPWVVHWHADVVSSAIDRRLALAYGLYRPFEQRLLRRSRAIIATSPPYLEASMALAPWRDRCVTIPLGIDRDRLHRPDPATLAWAEQQWGIGESHLRLLCLGRLTYYKGQQVLIEAALSLPGVRVLIAGEGERRLGLENQIAACGLNDRVSLVGFIPNPKVAALMATCDILCLPSLERTEAFGLVLLEAMRFAKPVVVSDIPGSGAPWVVRIAQNGRLVEPGKPTKLAREIEKLQQDPQGRRAMGMAGTHTLDQEFGIKPVASAILDLYARILMERNDRQGGIPPGK